MQGEKIGWGHQSQKSVSLLAYMDYMVVNHITMEKYCINSSKFFSIINSLISSFCCKIDSLVSKGSGGKINSL